MQLGLRQYSLPLLGHMLVESVLVDTGYVDQHHLARAYQAATTAPQVPSVLCDTIALELGLRSLTGHPLPLTDDHLKERSSPR